MNPLCSICLESLLDQSGFSKVKIDNNAEDVQIIMDKSSSQERKRKITGETPSWSNSISKTGKIQVSRAFVPKPTTAKTTTGTWAIPCGHVFHPHCLQLWLHNSELNSFLVHKPTKSKASKASQFHFRCPTCNSEFLEKKIIQIFLGGHDGDNSDGHANCRSVRTQAKWDQSQNGKPQPTLTSNVDYQMHMDLLKPVLDSLEPVSDLLNDLAVKVSTSTEIIKEVYQNLLGGRAGPNSASQQFDFGTDAEEEAYRKLKRARTGKERPWVDVNSDTEDEEQKEPPRKKKP